MANNQFVTLLHYILSDVVFPSFCANCGKLISNNDNGVCDRCRNLVSMSIKNYSGKYIFSLEEKIHGKRKWFLDDGVWLFKYEDPIIELIYSMKFKHNKSIARLFADYCIKAINLQKWQFDYITYIPISNESLWRRGFNQSEVIARYISKMNQHNLIKVFYLKNKKVVQKKLSSNERFINTYQKFDIVYDCYDNIHNKSFLIIDDVYTTGATINECARLLKINGARHVYACIIAYAMLKENI